MDAIGIIAGLEGEDVGAFVRREHFFRLAAMIVVFNVGGADISLAEGFPGRRLLDHPSMSVVLKLRRVIQFP